MITFNNIVERFKIFAENHFFVETFSFGSPDDVDLTKFTSFPLMHLVYTGATYDPGTKTYNLEIYILDVPADKTAKVDRQKEVVSDAEQCAEDIIADIKNGGNIFLFAQDYEVVNATTTPLEEETKNVLSGVLLDLSVSIPYEWDACNAPIDGVEPGGTEVTYARRGVLRMLTLDGATDVPSVRTIKVTNGTLTDDGDGVVTLDTGGVDTLAGLTDVDVTGVTDGQVLKYDDATGEWIPANDQSATSLGNLDDVSLATPSNREALIYDGDNWVNDNVTKADVGLGNVDNTSDADKPVSTATQTALDAKANTADVPTELNDLSDVTISGTPTGNQALIYNAATSAFLPLDNFTNRFEDDVERGAGNITPFVERAYGVKSDGDGIFIDSQSDTPSAGKKIVRKIYHKAGLITDTDVIGDYTLIHTFDDDTAYSATTSTFEGFRDGDTYGTPPFTLIQTWEEQTAAPAFTGLLNETYGSGAAAAYSVRRLNGNYTGAAIQVERSSDNTTQDIGFDSNGDLDESALTTFCTGTTCKVRSWYDQSQTGGTGSGNDAVQTTHANQPTIYTGGAIVKEKGRPAIDVNAHHLLFSSTLSFSGDFTQFLVTKKDTTTNAGSWFLHNGTAGTALYTEGYSGGGLPTLQNASVTQYVIHSSLANNFAMTTADKQRLTYANRRSTTGACALDGSAEKTATASFTGTVSYEAILGRTTGGFHSYDGLAQEAIFYASDKSTDRTSIESNIGDYFTQNTPLLDTYTGAAAAYSLRKLRSAYSGSAIRVRRASDNAEQDIGFNVFNELDTVSLASFCSGTDGFVKTWYDQSGNANDATQAATGSQPKIYDSSTGVVTENGKPAVEFNGSSSHFDLTWSQVASDYSLHAVTQNSASDLFLFDSTTGRLVFDGRGGTRGVYFDGSWKGTSHSGTAQQLQSIYAIAPSSGQSYVNSSQINTGLSYTQTAIGGGSVLGGEKSGSTFLLNGIIQEWILYASDQSTNRTNIEDNINTFYSIY